mmetsp:Transcript_39885/g.109849  ORF Transcript_39885/g.109849 Transcript_39885/m.109849 type:complete len:242 (+) Transcript_39885:820-1545(+)
MRVLAPTLGGERLARQHRHVCGEDLAPVLQRLLVKELPARHRDDGRAQAEALGRVDEQLHLRARADEHDLCRRLGGRQHDVRALGDRLDARGRQVGAALARERDHTRRTAPLERDCVRARHLVGIGGAERERVGGRAEVEQRLHRLVGGAVLAQPDRVVRRDGDHAKLGERRDAHRAQPVRGEVEERGAERDDAAVGTQPVADGCHRVLAHAEADVAPLGRRGLEVERAAELGQIGGRQVG